jgi:thioesterase domain-containing protein
MENPFDCVEDMARYYVEELNELQPCGPYILIGY